jgi:hypothetical protein
VAVAPRAPAALLMRCQPPALTADPDNPTLKAVGLDALSATQAAKDCAVRQDSLAKWVEGLK